MNSCLDTPAKSLLMDLHLIVDQSKNLDQNNTVCIQIFVWQCPNLPTKFTNCETVKLVLLPEIYSRYFTTCTKVTYKNV